MNDLPMQGREPIDHRARTKTRGWLITGVFALLIALAIVGTVVGGEVGQMMLAGAESLPLMVLAMLAYLGTDRNWAKVLALLWLVVLIAIVVLSTLVLSLNALSVNTSAEASSGLEEANEAKTVAILTGLAFSPLFSLMGFVRPVRRGLRHFLPIDPDSFVHTVALVTVLAMTMMSFVPLLVLSAPPLLVTVGDAATEVDAAGGRSSWGMLRDDIYALIWMIPAAVFAVGFGTRRTLSEALDRLGLVAPSRRQLLTGFGIGVGLVLAMHFIGMGIDGIWAAEGWVPTDEDAFSKLMAYTMSPAGALITGITAGLGEELTVRGVLQPRMGILLSNLFFTGLHALQYNWDALLTVFIIGLVMGVVRSKSNTTTSAIAHGSYDFFVILADVLKIPGLS